MASSKRAKRVINLTSDNDDDGEGGDGDFTEVSWLRTTRTARYLVRLILSSFIERIRVAGQLHSPYTALSDKVTRTASGDRIGVSPPHKWQPTTAKRLGMFSLFRISSRHIPSINRLFHQGPALTACCATSAPCCQSPILRPSHSPWLQHSSPQNRKKSSIEILSTKSLIATMIAFRMTSVASTRT